MHRLLLIVWLFAGVAHSQDSAESGLELDVKPVLCVTDHRNPVCRLEFRVTWESTSKDYYCVFNDLLEGPLRCWEDASSGETTDERDVEESFTFWMTGDDLKDRLAEVAIEVLRLDPDDRRRRRRTKHVWDIN